MEDWALEEEEQRHHDAKMVRLAKEKDIHDSLLAACEAAKKHLEPDLVEPGRSVFWKLVEAIKKAKGEA